MIRISKNGTEYTFNSVTGAARELGYNSPLNRESAFRYLEKQGFDLATLKEESTTQRKTTRRSSNLSIVERVVKMCEVVDVAKVNEVQNEINEAIASMTTAEDVKHIKALGEKLQNLKNPTCTREAVLNKFSELLDEYYEAQQAEEEEPQD